MKGLVGLSKCEWITYSMLLRVEKVSLPGFEPATYRSRSRHANHSATAPHFISHYLDRPKFPNVSYTINFCIKQKLVFVKLWIYRSTYCIFCQNNTGFILTSDRQTMSCVLLGLYQFKRGWRYRSACWYFIPTHNVIFWITMNSVSMVLRSGCWLTRRCARANPSFGAAYSLLHRSIGAYFWRWPETFRFVWRPV